MRRRDVSISLRRFAGAKETLAFRYHSTPTPIMMHGFAKAQQLGFPQSEKLSAF
jgi:hypothetical protein